MKIWKSTAFKNFLWLLPLCFCFSLLFGVGVAKAANYSNGSQYAGFSASSSTVINFNTVHIQNFWKEYDQDSGHFWLNITTSLTNYKNYIIATSSIYSFSNLDTLVENPTQSFTFKFSENQTISSNKIYFIFDRDSNSVLYDVISDGQGYNSVSGINYNSIGEYPQYDVAIEFGIDSDVEILQYGESDIYDIPLNLYSNPNDVFNYPYSQLCIYGEDCYLFFTYNKQIVGNEVELVDATSTNIIIATTTVIDVPLKQNKILLPEGSAGYRLATYVLLDDIWGQFIGHRIDIKWSTQEDWEAEMVARGILPNSNTLCDDIASSSEFYFGMACGLRQFGHWLLYPSAKDLNKLNEIFGTVKNQFPVTVGYQVYDLINTATSSATSSLEVPLKWYNGTTKTYDDTGVNLLDNTTLSTGLSKTMPNGQTLYQYISDLIAKIIYLIVLIYFVGRIFGIINPSYTASFDGLGIQSRRKEKQIYNDMKAGRSSNTLDLRRTSYGDTHGTNVINLRK